MVDLAESNRQRVDAILHGGGLEVRHRTPSIVEEHLGYGSRNSEYGDGGKDAIEIEASKRSVNSLECKVCTTLGMLTAEEAKQLKEAGLTAYNHNLDTSREFYPEVSIVWQL